jgi:hypothetical protein
MAVSLVRGKDSFDKQRNRHLPIALEMALARKPTSFEWHAREKLLMNLSQIREQMDVISSDRKVVGKVDHLQEDGRIKLTKQSSPDGQHHHFIPVSWIDHVDQHVHLNKSGEDVTAHWQHGQR